MFVLQKQKNFWALVRSNDSLKCEVILQLCGDFGRQLQMCYFQNLVPEVYVQQLSLQAFINQKFLILKKDASTSFLLVCS